MLVRTKLKPQEGDMVLVSKVLLIGLLCVSMASPLSAAETIDPLKASEEYQLGVMVKAITISIATPQDPVSFEKITRYGMDSRYYVMIRGWLVQELRGVESQIGSIGIASPELIEKGTFLRKTIRRIDLE